MVRDVPERPGEGFKYYLEAQGFSHNTILSYLTALNQFNHAFGQLTSQNLQSYRTFLLENFSPSTVNTRICAMNRYLDYVSTAFPINPNQPLPRPLPTVKCRSRAFVDSVISQSDYIRLKEELRREENWLWYFLVRIMACTGVRVSELLQIKAEHLQTSKHAVRHSLLLSFLPFGTNNP